MHLQLFKLLMKGTKRSFNKNVSSGPEITQLMRTAFSAAVKSDALPDLVSVVNTVLQSSDLR